MERRRLSYLLGVAGLGVITFPFLWLRLDPHYGDHTMGIAWAPERGLHFFTVLLPVFIIGALLWGGNALNRRFGWSEAVERLVVTEKSAALFRRGWSWVTMPLALSCAFWLSNSNLSLMTNVGIYMILALGLNITVGMTGLLVLGYAGFYAFGAYFLAMNAAWCPWWLALPLAFVLGGLVGWLIGLPCLRLRGDYLAIVTLGFSEAFLEIIRNLDITGSVNGLSISGHSTFSRLAGLASGQTAFIGTMLVLFLAVFLVQRLYHSPIGRAWMAIRENEVAAASLGVGVVRMKLLAFSLSAAIAAVAGVLYGAYNGFVSPEKFQFQESITILAMVILGGLGNSYGALLGAALLYLLPQYIQLLPSMISTSPLGAIVPNALLDALRDLSDYRLLLVGAIMVLMMLYRPQGLLGSRRRKTEMLHA